MDRALRLARAALETSDVGLALCVSLVALHWLWLQARRVSRATRFSERYSSSISENRSLFGSSGFFCWGWPGAAGAGEGCAPVGGAGVAAGAAGRCPPR